VPSELGSRNKSAIMMLRGKVFQEPMLLTKQKESHSEQGQAAQNVAISVHHSAAKGKKILAHRYFTLTTDSWTSLAHHSYTTCTTHFIDKNTWKLHSLVLGIFEKDGTSTAINTVSYVEEQL
jgi:hypothetical protein